jgi:hypothetical protein
VGSGGVTTTEVGVGTGGSSGGWDTGGEPDGTMTGGTAPLGDGLTAAAPDGAANGARTATCRGARGEKSTTDEVAVVTTALGGAAPIPPAPPGALTAGGVRAGVPAVQPTVTANGSPRATTLRKMDLGENRTHLHRIGRPKSYGVPGFLPSIGRTTA